jgi:predicted NBD/HSP70 family sugar kinase
VTSVESVELESGVCLGFGATNARRAVCEDGDIQEFASIETPIHPELFFDWMSRQLLDAANEGHEWLVAGFPGPVTPDGTHIGPMANVPGLSARRYNLWSELTKRDTAMERLFEEDFKLIAVNDGTLSAQAAATTIGKNEYDRTAALILGTGVGAGVVVKDPKFEDVHRADNANPLEIGHVLSTDNPIATYEKYYGGPAIQRLFQRSPKDMTAEHPGWHHVGHGIGRMATLLSLMNGVELVVPCGGVGAGGSEKYMPHLEEFMEQYLKNANTAQKMLTPEIIPVAPENDQSFEMFGAEGVMRDYLTRAA